MDRHGRWFIYNNEIIIFVDDFYLHINDGTLQSCRKVLNLVSLLHLIIKANLKFTEFLPSYH